MQTNLTSQLQHQHISSMSFLNQKIARKHYCQLTNAITTNRNWLVVYHILQNKHKKDNSQASPHTTKSHSEVRFANSIAKAE